MHVQCLNYVICLCYTSTYFKDFVTDHMLCSCTLQALHMPTWASGDGFNINLSVINISYRSSTAML